MTTDQQVTARLTQLQTQLGASAQEWTVLQDKLTKVLKLQIELNVGKQAGGARGGARGGAAGGAAGGAGGAPAAPALPTITVDEANPVSKAVSDLNTAANDTAATADALKPKLEALRKARTDKQKDLETAQKDLKGVVTVRQEAILVSLGILD